MQQMAKRVAVERTVQLNGLLMVVPRTPRRKEDPYRPLRTMFGLSLGFVAGHGKILIRTGSDADIESAGTMGKPMFAAESFSRLSERLVLSDFLLI